MENLLVSTSQVAGIPGVHPPLLVPNALYFDKVRVRRLGTGQL